MKRNKAYYGLLIVLLPFSILFFATAIIGVLLEELAELIQKPGYRFKKEIIKLANEVERLERDE